MPITCHLKICLSLQQSLKLRKLDSNSLKEFIQWSASDPMLIPLTPYIHMSAHHSLNGGQSSRGMQSPSCTTVSGGQLQPGSQISGQATTGSSHVPSHPLHSEYSWPPMGHAVRSREMWKKSFDRQKIDNCIYQKYVTAVSHSVVTA